MSRVGLPPSGNSRNATLSLRNVGWIADPEARSIEVFRLEDGQYQPAGWFRVAADDTLRSETFPGLELRLSDVFA